MMERLLRHKESLTEFLEHRTVPSLVENDWVKLRKLTDLLQPLKSATNNLGGQKYVTVSVTLPCFSQLVHCMADDDNDPAYVGQFKQALRDELVILKGRYSSNMLVKAATALDPRFKSLKCVDRDQRKAVWDHLTALLKLSLDDAGHSADTSDASSNTGRKRGYESSSEDEGDDDMDRLPLARVAAGMSLITATQAVNTYCKAVPQLDTDSDPIQWWNMNRAQHPLLAKLAIQHLCCPATSVPSERLFSRAGNIVTTKRASLAPENANSLICLSSWL